MRILIINDPFDRANRVVKDVDFCGGTVRDYKSLLGLCGDYVCAVSGKVVDDDHVPCAHDELVFVAELKNGATGWISVVAGAVLIAAGVYTGQAWMTTMGGSLVAGAAIGMVAKQFTPKIDSKLGTFENSQTYTWDGIQNIYGEGEPVPVLYGKHRVGGNVIAGFVSGDTTAGLQTNKYLHLLFAVSEGEVWGIEPDSIQIDGSPLAEFDADARVYYTNGTADQDLSAFGDSFSKIRRRYLFASKRINHGSSFPYTLKDSSDSALVTIVFPALFTTDSKGNLKPQAVSMRIEYAPVSSTEWVSVGDFECSASSKSSVEFDYFVSFPSTGMWKLRITRVSAEITDIKSAGDSYLRSVEEITDAKINYKHTAVLGVVLKATDRISGSIPTVTSVWRGRKIIDVRTLLVSETAYRNPANVLYDLLINTRYGLGRFVKSQTNIDINSFREFADFCDESVTYKVVDPESGIESTHTEKRFEFDVYLDTSSRADEILQKIAQTCRARVLWNGVRVKVVIDRAGAPVQLFNMGSIVSGSFSVTSVNLADIPNQIDADFADSDNEFERSTVSVIDTERLDEATNVRSVQLFGLTTQARVQRECMFALRKLKGTTRSVEFEAEIGAVVCEVGDIILVQHDMPKYGNGGRVHLDGNSLVFDKPVSVIAGEQYGLVVRRKDNTFYKHTLTAVSTQDIDALVLSGIDFEENDPWVFGIIDKEAKPHIITAITKGRENHTVAISAAEYNASIYSEDGIKVSALKYSALGLTKVGSVDNNGNVIDVTPQTPVNPKQVVIPFVSNISVDQSGMYAVVDGLPMTSVTVNWDRVYIPNVSSGFISKYEVLLSEDLRTWASVFQSGGSSAVVSNIIIGKSYYVAIRAHSAYGTSNDPAGAGEYFEFSVDMPLMNAISGITCGSGLYAINVAVSFAPSSVFAACELWMSGVNDRVGASLVGSGVSGRFAVNLNEIGGTRYFWARLKDIFGNYNGWYPESATAGVVGVTSYDADLLLNYLEGEIGLPQLASDIAKKIEHVSAIDTALTGPVFYEQGAFYIDDEFFVDTAAGITDVEGRLTLQKSEITALQTQSETIIADVAQAKLDIVATNDNLGNLVSTVNTKASAASVDGLTARVTTAEQDISSVQDDIGNLEATVNTKASVSSVDALGEQYAAVSTELTATKDDVAGLKGQLVFKVDVNGHVTGMGVYADSSGSSVVWLGDKFLFMAPDGSGTPKQVVGMGYVNGVYQLGLNGSLIVDGSIVARMVGANEIIANSANIKDGVVTNAKIANAAITTAKIADIIQSTNYVEGASGWKIQKSGAAEFNNVTVRGVVDAAQIKSSYFDVNGLKLVSAAGGDKYCPTLITKTNTVSGVDHVITDYIYGYNYGSGYNASRVASSSPIFVIKVFMAVDIWFVSGDSGPPYTSILLSYSLDDGAWVQFDAFSTIPNSSSDLRPMYYTKQYSIGGFQNIRFKATFSSNINGRRYQCLSIDVQVINM
ncbi:TipJ family phage tail tip protein [Seleniivibrio woodruffii]|uniref:TipJ family phage tail tip protein n=1 Tax=Seleniivibrio woodruffii TaxID=1078050 RepID=UPI0024099A4C|nr:phage tail protein [Seleniivibrio woodruffii]